MKRVLLPTDFSENSVSAINYAMALLKSESCEFYILNVQKASSYITDDMMIVSPSSTVYKTLIESAKKSVDNLISDLKTNFSNPNHSFNGLVDYDNFADAINQVSDTNDIDFIIMGTKGTSGIEKMIFGSNTVRVMQHCDVPVLAIPKHCSYSSLNSLAFLINNLKALQPKSLKVLNYLLEKNDAKLKLLSTGTLSEQEALQTLASNFIKSHFPLAEHEFLAASGNNLYEVVHDYIETHSVKLLCIVSKHHSFLEQLFSNEPIENLAFKMNLPFLVMHNED
ncbi:universal stress protein [Tamlana crocina]